MTELLRTRRHVVIAGGSFAGLAAAFTLRKRLAAEDRITVTDPKGVFLFRPSLVAAALGRPPLRASFEIAPALRSKGIEFVSSTVRGVDVNNRRIETDDGRIDYDALIIATGARPNPNAVAGGAGEFSHNHYMLGQASAEDVRNRILSVTRDPSPVLIGAIQGASYVSAMYELALGMDQALRQAGVREQAPLTFLTPEPFLGHLGFGQVAARTHLERMFREREIDFRVESHIVRIDKDEVILGGGEALASPASFFMPPFTGGVDLWKTAGLTDELGFVPIDEKYKHVMSESVYAAGESARFISPVPPIWDLDRPHTGYLSVRMGVLAAENVAADLGHGPAPRRVFPRLLDLRIIEGPSAGLLLSSYGVDRLRHRAVILPAGLSRRLKKASERYVVRGLRTGRIGRI